MSHSSSEFENQTFSGLTYDAENSLKYLVFLDCNFNNCSFLEADLSGSTFRDCTFSGCGMGPANIRGASFEGVAFIDCRVIGLNWPEAIWSKTASFALSFTRCRVGYLSFANIPLRKITMVDCKADEIDFSGADLSGGIFTDTVFTGCRFNGTDLSKADLRDAAGYVIHPGRNTVKGLKVSMPDAMGLLAGMGIEIS